MQFDKAGARKRRLHRPLTRSIEGLSNTMEARCGMSGNPFTLLRPLVQFTFNQGGWPRSARVAGALNSAISNLGW